MTTRLSPLLVIVGETASGKSALAVELARRFEGEIICADSWTVRRGTNIGTAKPTAEQRALVKHHLLDLVEPCADFTAAVFKRLATETIEMIGARGKLPILVGGTGLYVDGVIYDFGFLPPGDRQVREELNQLTLEQLLKLIERRGLRLGDVDRRNKRRLIRLLETGGAEPAKHRLRGDTLIVGLKPRPEDRRTRITARVDAMLAAGLEKEVAGLVERCGWDCEGLKGIGYAQWRGYFDGAETLDQTRDKIIKDSLDLAKRQRTWFKRNKSIRWISTPVNLTEVVDLVTTFLASRD